MGKKKSLDLGHEVYSAIKEMIITGALVPGDKLSQNNLAEKLGVSRTPLISAFSKLHKENIVQIIPNRGVYVKRFNMKEIIDIYNIRLQLEPLGAYEASRNATPERIETLHEILRNYERAIQENASQEVTQIDAGFHIEIMRYSDNKFLYDMLKNFNIIILSNRIGILNKPEKSLKDHRLLLESIAKKNAAEARKIMHRHIRDALDNLYRFSVLDNTYIKMSQS